MKVDQHPLQPVYFLHALPKLQHVPLDLDDQLEFGDQSDLDEVMLDLIHLVGWLLQLKLLNHLLQSHPSQLIIDLMFARAHHFRHQDRRHVGDQLHQFHQQRQLLAHLLLLA